MRLSSHCRAELADAFQYLKEPASGAPPAQTSPAVVDRVSEMLRDIESGGMAAVLRFASELDGWRSADVEVSGTLLRRSGDALGAELREALELGAARTGQFAAAQRARLTDFETELVPGVVAGHRYVPVRRVGAYLPAGRFPLTASALMTVNVAKVAGVATVLACTPPRPDGTADPAVLYAAHISGADRVFLLGGVQALAAMAFGLLGERPVDMLVGAGNAYVAEAKRQLFGRVAIDLPAGPSEVAVIADDAADPAFVAADLLGQAEHGPDSPAALVTTSRRLGWAVLSEVDKQLAALKTRDIAGPAWHNHGSVIWTRDAGTAVQIMNDLAPEHLEIQTEDDDFYHRELHSYGSLFLGRWSTVAYSDKGMAGTNHVLPTARGARHSAGLSVSRFLKPLTYQRVSRSATAELASAVDVISEYEGMAAHRATAVIRLNTFGQSDE